MLGINRWVVNRSLREKLKKKLEQKSHTRSPKRYLKHIAIGMLPINPKIAKTRRLTKTN